MVLERVKADKYKLMNFNEPVFSMLSKYYSSKARVRPQLGLKSDKANGSGHSTDEEHIPAIAPKPTPLESTPMRRKESDNNEMRRLTRNLSQMVRKFDDFEGHPSIIFDLMEGVPGHGVDLTQVETGEQFRRELENNNISAIKPKRQLTEPEDHYGFGERRRPLQPRQTNRVQEDRRGSYCHDPKLTKEDYLRVQTDYNCEEIRRKKGKSRVGRPSKDRLLKPKSSLSKKEGSSVGRSRVLIRRG